jgi:hypothetical protein
MDERGWSQAELGRHVGCTRSTIGHILNGDVNQSPYIPDIHRVFDWTPPQSPMPTVDTEELLKVWAMLNPSGKDRLLERAQVLTEDPKLLEDAKRSSGTKKK